MGVAVPAVVEAGEPMPAQTTVERRGRTQVATVARARVALTRMAFLSLLVRAKAKAAVRELGLSVHELTFRRSDLLIDGPYITRPCMT